MWLVTEREELTHIVILAQKLEGRKGGSVVNDARKERLMGKSSLVLKMLNLR